MAMRRIFRIGLCSLVTVGVVACGLVPPKPMKLYEGPDLPRDQLAVLGARSPTPGRVSFVTVTKIDGKEIYPEGYALPSKGIYLKPRKVRVSLMYMSFGTVENARAEGDVEVDLKPGHFYVPDVRRFGGDRVLLVILDKGTDYNPECLGTGVNHGRPVQGC
jgi:hypothetical protein